MRGTILGFDPVSGEGVISESDGGRVKFARAAWKSPGEPVPGRAVDYDLSGDQAIDIFVVPGSDPLGFGTGDPASSAMTWGIISLVCAVLTFMLGPFGVFTLIAAIVFGLKGKRAGADLPDKTAYYLSIAGLVVSAVALLIVLLALAACGAFIGLVSLAPGGWR